MPGSPTGAERSAAETLSEMGRWEGQTYEELIVLFAGFRQRTSRLVPDLGR